MSEKLSRVRAAVYGMPWAIKENWLELMCEILEKHASGEKPEFDAAALKTRQKLRGNLKQIGFDPKPDDAPYQLVNGVAILELMGPIFPRANLMTEVSGATSLEDYGANFDAAMEDPEVETILQYIDSPGGSVIGLAEMASKIHAARMAGDKLICSLIEGMGCSAAYMLGSQGEICNATEGSMVGSIGTIIKMQSADRMEKNFGIDTTVLRSSELKAPGVGPMSPRQEDSMRKILQSYFDQFKSAVVRGRPGVNIDQVATGEVWIGKDSKAVGLVDEITTLPEMLQDLAS